MSFDLFFCRESKAVPTLEELARYFQSQSNFKITPTNSGGSQFWYNNEATGVYCQFDLDLNVDDEIEVGSCSASGLSFNLNFLRPSFFAYEAMPLVENFCREFQLTIEDPQKDSFVEAAATKLIASWRESNTRAVSAMASDAETEINLKYYPEVQATGWWRYMYERQDLEDKLTEDIFVPSIFLVETPDKELVSMIVWPDGISQLFPECDFVFVERTKKKLFGERREMGLIPYNEVIATINPYLGNYSTTAGPVKYLPPSRKADIPSILQRLNLRPAKLSSYNRVSPDSFHDVELPTE